MAMLSLSNRRLRPTCVHCDKPYSRRTNAPFCTKTCALDLAREWASNVLDRGQFAEGGFYEKTILPNDYVDENGDVAHRYQTHRQRNNVLKCGEPDPIKYEELVTMIREGRFVMPPDI